MNDLDFRVLSYLTFCSKTGSYQSFPKVSTIAEKCQSSVSSVKRSLKRLLDRKLIEKASRKGGGAVIYQFSFLDKPVAKIIDIHTKRELIDELPDYPEEEIAR